MIRAWLKRLGGPRCPQCGGRLLASQELFIWTLKNGVRLHGGCWPAYFEARAGEAIKQVFETSVVYNDEPGRAEMVHALAPVVEESTPINASGRAAP